MLSGYKKVKMVLEMKFQDKTKSKRCDCPMQKMLVGRHSFYKRKDIYSETCSIWAFSKRHVSEAPTPS